MPGAQKSTILLLLLVCTWPEPANAFVMHSTLSSCVVTWGDFCPVESFAGSLVLTLIVAGVGAAAAYLNHRAKLKTAKPKVLKLAKDLLHAGRQQEAFKLLSPYLMAKDPDALALVDAFNRMGDELRHLSSLMKSGRFEEALRLGLALANDGQPDAQFAVGAMLYKKTDQRQEGLRWIGLASARGVKRASEFLFNPDSNISAEERADIAEFLGRDGDKAANPSSVE